MDSGTLFVVATPIGNRQDLTPRARQILNDVDLIAAEDTRHTRRLLSHFNINTRQIVLHDHNEEVSAHKLISVLKGGKSVALVSDAGTPLISDPGYRIVNLASKENIEVVTIPGPSAVTAALSISGIPTDHFYFEGFLPPKKGRKGRFELLKKLPATIVMSSGLNSISSIEIA